MIMIIMIIIILQQEPITRRAPDFRRSRDY